MIDLDIYRPNKEVEEFLQSLKVRFKKDYSPIKVYISTANTSTPWLEKLYNFYNNTELMEVQNESK